MDTDNFSVYIKTKGLEKKFGTSNYEVERPLLKQKNKKSNWINER